MDIERIKRAWEAYNRGQLESDEDMKYLLDWYTKFAELHRVFDPRPNLFSTLESLERSHSLRKRKD